MSVGRTAGKNDGRSCPGVEVIPLPHALGAEIRCGDVRALDDASAARIRQAFLDHLVLLFRGQKLDDHELMDFGRRFGELAPTIGAQYHASNVKEFDPALKHISVVSNVIENGVAIGALGDGEAVWHSDFSFHEVPYSASLLHSLEIPPFGGNTGFLNMYLAHDTLPAELRAEIRGRTIKQDASHNSAGQLRKGFAPVTDVRSSPGPTHPIVSTHPETGRHALYLGRRPYAYVNGLSVEQSEALLDKLWAHATQARFGWHHVWEVGDVLVWDNRCTMHHRDAFDPNSRRIMHKTACVGSRPVEQASYAPPHPRGAAFIEPR
jgi:alpha-ketoglutarate-dependent taurine dioxygenase